jgi:DNA topoisomerase I
MDDLHRDPVASAERAGLRYVADDEPGIRRRKQGKGFTYVGPGKSRLSDEDRARCAALVIPPAWTDVWICRTSDGHLQATGRDARGRKQYRYHSEWSQLRQMIKYDRLRAFGEALPAIRERIDADLALRGVPREKVLATVLALMARTMIRIGNAEYARDNESFGLTTMRRDHVEIDGATVRFRFKAKSGKWCETDLSDRRLSRIVRQIQELRGQELFAYTDDAGVVRDVRSEDVNRYLAEIGGQTFTAKDLRTWGGTVRAFRALREAGPCDDPRTRKRTVTACIRDVAARLGNTPAVCRTYYVHPVVLAAYEDGTLFSVELPDEPTGGLGRSEHGVLSLLREPRRERRVA